MDDMEQRRLLTVEEYVEREAVSEERHEFWDGKLRMVSGNTDVHCETVMNVGMLLREHLKEQNERGFFDWGGLWEVWVGLGFVE